VAAAIEKFLRPPSFVRSIERGAPLAGTLPPMLLPAAERATQVSPPFVSGMREKADPTMNAANGAPLKLGVRL